jgi:hypothetical protein
MSNPTKYVPYVIKTGGSISLYLNGESLTVNIDHPNYSKVVDALKSGDHSKIDSLVNIAKAVTNYAKGGVRIENGTVYFGTFALHNTLTNRILKMMNEGFKFDHMTRFLENLVQNPSSRAVNETYTFLENYGLPITDDGCFLAYKAVNRDYLDIFSRTIDNSIGATPSMPRFQVDETYERDCSTGLHVGALDYVVQYGHFTKGQSVSPTGNRLLIVKVNPRDVVSVPKYENHPKMRVSTYTVVSEINDVVKELDKIVYTSNAQELTPDEVDLSKIDVDLVHDEPVSSYDDGFRCGDEDQCDGVAYGYSRDYDIEGDYVKGYNDGYNARGHRDVVEAVVAENDVVIAPKTYSSDYDAGFDLGLDDRFNYGEYGHSKDCSLTGPYLSGYNDGYNLRDYNGPN